MQTESTFTIDKLGKLKHDELEGWSQSALDKSLPEWIVKIHSFLREWFSSDTQIRLQTSGTVAKKTYFLREKKYLSFSAKESLSVLKIPNLSKTLTIMKL